MQRFLNGFTRGLLLPLCWIFSWYFYYAGCIFYWVLNWFPDNQRWVEYLYECYNTDMTFSVDFQERVNGEGKHWPWGEHHK